jgi:putative hydrolase of the HAD superfamily
MNSATLPAQPFTHIETIAFDADDTLWHNEDGFHHVAEQFAALVTPHADPTVNVLDALMERERVNVTIFGYGVKSSTFSMIETANDLTRHSVTGAQLAKITDEIVSLGRWLLTRETLVFDDAQPVLSELAGRYRMVLITKGDSHHQLAKVDESGLRPYFDHVEVVAEKDAATYSALANRHQYDLTEFLMVGNSIKSDVLPVLEAGGVAVHIPYAITWGLEQAEVPAEHPALNRFRQASRLRDVPALL